MLPLVHRRAHAELEVDRVGLGVAARRHDAGLALAFPLGLRRAGGSSSVAPRTHILLIIAFIPSGSIEIRGRAPARDPSKGLPAPVAC
ncbi:MAG: hypothetical protein U1F25_20340 [Rubrivivax sp.]